MNSLPVHVVCEQLQYGEPVIRRAVPLALALLSMSHPQLTVIDTLSKLSHDSDSDVVHNAILAMGLVGSGNPQCSVLITVTTSFHLKTRYQQCQVGRHATSTGSVLSQGPTIIVYGPASTGTAQL